ncbi:hypothetical protein TvY486_0026480 [Trypanosoma vivax Y486]|uniref:Uncharacterized protein n=1 Tax=Trypanosoma vivax (strain Y486) TaxID=1055687 RepID=F9WQS7_TRYVY|nr:hypothetical protein TvY486_0026480 [Trypanosoma vivax Y486]|eukprot:CCD19909.1 hypothetical protein TvY486_0026480 [Trypanosoma vivax Y486]
MAFFIAASLSSESLSPRHLMVTDPLVVAKTVNRHPNTCSSSCVSPASLLAVFIGAWAWRGRKGPGVRCAAWLVEECALRRRPVAFCLCQDVCQSFFCAAPRPPFARGAVMSCFESCDHGLQPSSSSTLVPVPPVCLNCFVSLSHPMCVVCASSFPVSGQAVPVFCVVPAPLLCSARSRISVSMQSAANDAECAAAASCASSVACLSSARKNPRKALATSCKVSLPPRSPTACNKACTFSRSPSSTAFRAEHLCVSVSAVSLSAADTSHIFAAPVFKSAAPSPFAARARRTPSGKSVAINPHTTALIPPYLAASGFFFFVALSRLSRSSIQ